MSERLSELGSRWVRAPIVGGYYAAGAYIGANIANTYVKPTVELVPGSIKAKSSMSFDGQGLRVTYGDQLDVPNVPIKLPVTGDARLDVDILPLNVPVDDPEFVRLVAGLMADPTDNIFKPLIFESLERMAIGASLGAVIIGGLTHGAANKFRAERGWTRHGMKNIARRLPKAWIAALGAAVISTGASVATNDDSPNGPVGNQAAKVALSTDITDNSSYLEGATVTGASARLTNRSARLIIEYRKSVEDSMQDYAVDFKTAFEEYAASSKFFGNSEYTVAGHFSDAHCNFANFKYVVGAVVEAFQPTIILENGDFQATSGEMPLEKNCMRKYMESIEHANKETDTKTDVVLSLGNHDSKDDINIDGNPRVITPRKDKNYTVETEIGPVIALKDRSDTTFETKPPEDSSEMRKVIAEQGRDAAAAACKHYEETGEQPIVMTHRVEAPYKTSVLDCASLILNGHTHENKPFKKLLTNSGKVVVQHTAGSISGSKNTLSYFETPKRDATLTFMFFKDKKLVGNATVTLFANGGVKIEERALTTKSEGVDDLTERQEYLEANNP